MFSSRAEGCQEHPGLRRHFARDADTSSVGGLRRKADVWGVANTGEKLRDVEV